MAIVWVMIGAAVWAGTLLVCRRRMERAYGAVDAVLDDALAGREAAPLAADRDTRLSKLAHKAAKVARLREAAACQVEREKETIQSFISDMSHQMKTPLASIRMYTDLLGEGGLSQEEREEFLRYTRENTDKLQWMTDSLIKMSRLEIGAIELTPVPAGIRGTIADSISSVQGAAARRDVTIRTESFPDAAALHDRRWTAEALANILENAVKYSAPHGQVVIGAERLPLFTKVVVTNWGRGIAPEEQSAVFRRFYRGKNAGDTDGAGLGLYISSLIMEKQGGYILVDSVPGQRTSFSLFLQNCKE